MDPYEVLGVSPHATSDEVRTAYRRLVRRHHPDRHVGESSEVQAAEAARMAEVTGAFTLLNDPTALARHQARTSRVGRTAGAAPDGNHGPTRTTNDHDQRPGRDETAFDYRRAATSEFDDPVAGRWGRTPIPPPRAGPATPTRVPRRRPRDRRRRWPTVVGWSVLLVLVVGGWLVATDSGQTVGAILRGVVGRSVSGGVASWAVVAPWSTGRRVRRTLTISPGRATGTRHPRHGGRWRGRSSTPDGGR